MMALYAGLSRRYLLGKKGRSLITLLGIALGVTMVVAVALTNQSIIGSYESLLAAAAGRADLQVNASAGNGFPEGLLAEASAVDGVEAAVPVVSSGAVVMSGERKGNATFYGIDEPKDRLVREYKLQAGRLPQVDAREVAVSQDLAEGLELQVGDQVRLLTTRGMQEFQVAGLFDARGTVRGTLGPFGLVPIQTAQEIFGREGRFDLIDLVLVEGAEPDAVRDRLAEKLGSAVKVGTPVERSQEMKRLLDSLTFLLTMAGSISLFAGVFIIFTNVSMGVAERRRDLSILRAVGMRRGEVMRLVLAEAGLQGLLGSLLGLAWGYGLASAMAQQMTSQFLAVYQLQMTTVTLTPAAIATGLAVGLGAALVAAFAPARETVLVSPVEAMRPEAAAAPDSARPARIRAAVGVILLAGSAAAVALTWPSEGMIPPLLLRIWSFLLVLMLFSVVLMLPAMLTGLHRFLLRPALSALLGVTGRLAADNLVRRPTRTSATVSALMVSLSFMVAMGVVSASQLAAFEGWYEKAVAWDLNVSSSFVGMAAQVEMDAALLEELAKVEGVELVSPQKMHATTLPDGQTAFLQAFDHHLLRRYSETPMEVGDWTTVVDQMEQGGGVIISPAVAHRLQVGLGETIQLATPLGERPFTVRGIMTDITPYGGTVQIDRRDYLAYWQDPSVTNIAVVVKEGVDAAVVKQRLLDRWGDSLNLLVRLNLEFWQELRAQYDAVYSLLDGLTWIAVMVSGLAIANTLFAAVLERKREVGILRAIGTRQGEVIRMVAGEALGTGAVGGALGLTAGLALAGVMVSSLERVNGSSSVWTVDWTAVGSALVVALVIAPLVGMLPARWASRLDVVDALRYE